MAAARDSIAVALTVNSLVAKLSRRRYRTEEAKKAAHPQANLAWTQSGHGRWVVIVRRPNRPLLCTAVDESTQR